MARRGGSRRRGRPSGVAIAFRNLVEAIADKVADRMQRQVPGRDQVRRVERQVRRLIRRIESGGLRPGARRVGRPRSDRRCKIEGCGLPHVAHGFCSKHYQAWRRRKIKAATGKNEVRAGRRSASR